VRVHIPPPGPFPGPLVSGRGEAQSHVGWQTGSTDGSVGTPHRDSFMSPSNPTVQQWCSSGVHSTYFPGLRSQDSSSRTDLLCSALLCSVVACLCPNPVLLPPQKVFQSGPGWSLPVLEQDPKGELCCKVSHPGHGQRAL